MRRRATWLVLASLLALLAFAGLPAGRAAASVSPCLTDCPPPVPDYVQAEMQMFKLINGYRAAQGLATLTWNTQLAAAARKHSDQLIAKGGCPPNVHQCPGEPDLSTRIADQGFSCSPGTCAENAGTWWTTDPNPDYSQGIQGIFNCWISEEHQDGYRTHYDNIVDPTFTDAGVGVSID